MIVPFRKLYIGAEKWFHKELEEGTPAYKVIRALAYLIRKFDREILKRKKKLNWWLVYGHGRAGTSLMFDYILPSAKFFVSDWTMEDVFKLGPEDEHHDYVRYDRERALRNISGNIIDNAYVSTGRMIDIAYKQVFLSPNTYRMLERVWGEPRRKIFCYREPEGYAVSARKKWPDMPLEEIQNRYVKAFDAYREIGGDVFEYRQGLKKEDYISFLKLPKLKALKDVMPDFECRGDSDPDLVTDHMRSGYKRFKQEHLSAG